MIILRSSNLKNQQIMDALKKGAAYVLVFIVLAMTILSILGIWEIVDLDHVLNKAMKSLFIIFIAAVVYLFIFSVLIRDNDPKRQYFERKSKDQNNNM